MEIYSEKTSKCFHYLFTNPNPLFHLKSRTYTTPQFLKRISLSSFCNLVLLMQIDISHLFCYFFHKAYYKEHNSFNKF